MSGVSESRPEATQFQFEVQDLNEPELKEVLLNWQEKFSLRQDGENQDYIMEVFYSNLYQI